IFLTKPQQRIPAVSARTASDVDEMQRTPTVIGKELAETCTEKRRHVLQPESRRDRGKRRGNAVVDGFTIGGQIPRSQLRQVGVQPGEKRAARSHQTAP